MAVSSVEDDVNDIAWDADVIVLGGRQGSPLLVVDENGVIQALNNVSVWADAAQTVALGLGDNVGTDYFVLIENDGYADIFFGAERNIANQARADGSPRWPLFVFRDNLESVTIIDRADSEMHLVGVDVINRTGRDPMVQISTIQGAGSFDEDFGFDLRHSISPYLITVDIQKLGTPTDVYIDGCGREPDRLDEDPEPGGRHPLGRDDGEGRDQHPRHRGNRRPHRGQRHEQHTGRHRRPARERRPRSRARSSPSSPATRPARATSPSTLSPAGMRT